MAGYGGVLGTQGNPGQGFFPANNQPPPPPSVTNPGSNPFASDPGYAAALAAQQAGIPGINASLASQIAQRIAAYGDPGLADQAGFGLDPQAAAFARQNYLSGNAELARLDKAHQQNRQAVINQLAGHGLLFSGDTGYQEGNVDQGYGNSVYDAQQKALADILGYRQGAQGQISSLQNQTLQALENAYQGYMANPQLNGNGSLPPPPNTKLPSPAKTVAASLKRPVSMPNAYLTGQKKNG